MTRFRKIDAAATVTALMLEKLKTGTAPWVRPWSTTGMRPARHNGLPYMGVNTLYLWAIAIPRPWLNAIVPAVGFALSTFALGPARRWWERRHGRKAF